MASKKDFAPNQRRRKQPASTSTRKPTTPKKTESKAPVKPKPAPKEKPVTKKPWKLILAGIIVIGVIFLLLQKLTSVDPREMREAGITALINDKVSQETVPNIEPTTVNTQKNIPIKPTATKPKAAVTKKPLAIPIAKANDKKEKTVVVKKVPVAEKSIEAEKKEPYQFYEMLSSSSVDTETIEAYKSTPKTAKLQKKTLLQTGSFRNEKDAERMKARLILNNLSNVSVDKTVSNNGTWYRVRSGPYITFDKLKAALVKLNKMNISALQVPLS